MRKMWMVPAIAGLMLTGILSGASAATVSFSDTIAEQSTNWTSNFVLPYFDSNLGTLDSITFLLSGVGDVDAGIESLDAAPSTITASYLITLVTGVPASLTLAMTDSGAFSATAFDGTVDFAGTSGTHLLAHLTGSTSNTLLSGLGAYENPGGVGTYSIGATASGGSTFSGAGNLISLIQTQAGATIEVTYSYHTQDVPEPGALAMVGIGLLSGVAVLRRRRSTK